MVEEQVRGAASGSATPDADIISAWQSDFDALKTSVAAGGKVELTLPTGKQIKAIRIPLVMLMQQGAIPDSISHLVSQFIEGIEGGDPKKTEEALLKSFQEGGDMIASAQRWIELINFVCVNCIATPRFVMEQKDAKPEKGIFWIAQMNFYDKQYVFQWAQGVDRSVREFLQEQTDAMGASPYGEGVRLTTEQLLASGDAREFMVLVSDQPGGVAVGPIHSGEDRRDDGNPRSEDEKAADADRPEAQPGSGVETAHAAD